MTTKIINSKKIEIENTKIPCKCGCGTLIWKFDVKSRERVYARGHAIKININCWNKGKKNVYSEDTLEKMSKAKLGKKHEEETKKKMSLSHIRNDDLENYKRKKARWGANDHIRIKSDCEICHSNENLEKHHWDYSRPLFVAILCKECHEIQHIKNFHESRFATQEVLA